MNDCENITNKYYNIGYVNKLKKLLEIQTDNPQVIIENIKIKNNISINIIQDGYLLAGTKQRVVTLFIKEQLKKNNKIKTLLYAGSSNGYGAVACAYAAYKLGLNCNVFLSIDNIPVDIKSKGKLLNTRQINSLHALKANIILCDTFKKARNFEYKFGFYDTIEWIPKPEYYVSPMGFNDDSKLMVKLLSIQIKEAIKGTLIEKIKNPRIWLVTGSGGILMSLYKAIPNAYFFILLTGGMKYKTKIINWIKDKKNIKIIKDDLELNKMYNNIYDRQIYYSSVEGYDDKIWIYVKKFAKNNDFIWNVSSDDYIF